MRNNKKGFTLLEIIIVIIIVGVLASLALPRLFNTVEYSKSTEALAAFGTIRSAMERCALQRGDDMDNCDDFANLDIPNPSTAPGAHFGYSISAADSNDYTITATRNTTDAGDGGSVIRIEQDGEGGTVTKSGTGAFSKLN